MSDKESSSSDMECDDVTEGATVRVVQSSMHASIKQNSLFKVTENKKESDQEDSEEEPPASKPEEKPEPPPEEEQKKEEAPIEENPPKVENIEEPQIRPEENQVKIEENEAKIEKSDKEEPIIEKKPEKKTYSKAIMKILADEKPKKAEKINVEKRFYDYQAKVDKKIKDLKEAQDKEEQELCTFAPKIKNHSEKRKFEQFLKHVTNFSKAKQDRIQKVRREREEEIEESILDKPTLSEKTIQLTKSSKPKGPIYVRLFEESNVLKTKQEQLIKETLSETHTFHPKIEPAPGLNREGDTRTRLYEMSKEKPKVEKVEKKVKKLINEESESILLKKLEKIFNELLPQNPVSSPQPEGSENPKPAEDSLNFTEFLNFLIKLNFVLIKEGSTPSPSDQDLASKAWTLLNGAESSTVPIVQIKSFISSILTPSSPKSQKQHLTYLQFYHNFHKPAPSQLQKPIFSFKPSILPKSQKLAAIVNETRATNAANKKIEHILYTLHDKKLKKNEEKKKNIDLLISPECTFRPVTNRGPNIIEEDIKDNISLSSDYLRLLSENKFSRHEVLYSFSKVELERKEKASRTVEDWEIERNMGECSFVPDLDKPKIDWKAGNEAKGVEQALERMSRAREDKKSESFVEPMRFSLIPDKNQKVK